MLSTSKNVLFPGHNHLPATGANIPSLLLSPSRRLGDNQNDKRCIQYGGHFMFELQFGFGKTQCLTSYDLFTHFDQCVPERILCHPRLTVPSALSCRHL